METFEKNPAWVKSNLGYTVSTSNGFTLLALHLLDINCKLPTKNLLPDHRWVVV